MKFQDRANTILEMLRKNQTVKVEELSSLLQVSVVTMRKDLQKLEDDGKLIRTFGGAASGAADAEEQRRIEAMQIIAERTAQEVQDGDCVILDAGTTTLLTAQKLRGKHLKVITNAISVAREMNRHKGTQVILLGGELTGDAVFTHGSEAIKQLEQYGADKLILSISGISCESGITTRHMEAGDLFRKMIERAEKVIIPADDTKIGFESFYHVGDLKVADKLITNDCAENETELKKMEELGIEICRC